jgi:Uma2 family endonuclease
MTIAAQPTAPTAPAAEEGDVPTEPIYRLSVAQYHAMARHGILDEDAPVELLEGWLVQKMTKYRPHSRCTHRIRRALEGLVPAGWYVDSQEPVTTAESEPEPDVMIIRGANDDYADRQPGLGEIALVVEVAESSLRRDRGTKLRVYARAGIPVYWIANLPARCFEIYTAPTGPSKRPGYGQRQEYGPVEEIPVLLDGKEIGRLKVGDLLP